MARASRGELFDPSEVAIVHVIAKVVQGGYLLGVDPQTGKNFDHRKQWIEAALERASANFGIDLIAYSLMCTHMHLVLRSRPDVVKKWDDTEVARRWLMLCPVRKNKDGSPKEPRTSELNAIRNDTQRLKELRRRLSDISWWMRWVCQRIGQRANRESQKSGNFWQSRYHAVRLLDETAVLACAVYVDLNPIRAAMAETIEDSPFTSARKRALSLQQQLANEKTDGKTASEEGAAVSIEDSALNSATLELHSDGVASNSQDLAFCDSFLAPVQLIEGEDETSTTASSVSQQATSELGTRVEGAQAGETSTRSRRCSDKGFTFLSAADYLQLLDWTARQTVLGKRGSTPEDAPPIFQRLNIGIEAWCKLVHHFRDCFFRVAGKPDVVDAYRSRLNKAQYRIPQLTRETLAPD